MLQVTGPHREPRLLLRMRLSGPCLLSNGPCTTCTHPARALHGPCAHPARTLHTPCTHPVRALHTPCTHPAHTLHRPCTHFLGLSNGLCTHPVCVPWNQAFLDHQITTHNLTHHRLRLWPWSRDWPIHSPASTPGWSIQRSLFTALLTLRLVKQPSHPTRLPVRATPLRPTPRPSPLARAQQLLQNDGQDALVTVRLHKPVPTRALRHVLRGQHARPASASKHSSAHVHAHSTAHACATSSGGDMRALQVQARTAVRTRTSDARGTHLPGGTPTQAHAQTHTELALVDTREVQHRLWAIMTEAYKSNTLGAHRCTTRTLPPPPPPTCRGHALFGGH